jgi:hypothetical protein
MDKFRAVRYILVHFSPVPLRHSHTA